MKEKATSVLSLFTSVGTLVCCALPALLVTLGLGAVVASTVSGLPWLMALSRHKTWLFLGAGLLLALNFFLVYRPRQQTACDVSGGQGCEVTGGWNRGVLWVSTAIYAIGVSVAYLALPIAKLFE